MSVSHLQLIQHVLARALRLFVPFLHPRFACADSKAVFLENVLHSSSIGLFQLACTRPLAPLSSLQMQLMFP